MRKQVFTREDVLSAGVAVVEDMGWSMLSARHVAERLGSSTAPVYSNFTSMEALAAAVREALVAMLLAEADRTKAEDPFLGIGLGVLKFARDHPSLYSALFLGPDAGCTAGALVMQGLLERMGRLPGLAELDTAERTILLRKMAIFTHGLASQLCGSTAPRWDWEEMRTLLAEVGETLVRDAFCREKRSPSEVTLLARFHGGTSLDSGGLTTPHNEQGDMDS